MLTYLRTNKSFKTNFSSKYFSRVSTLFYVRVTTLVMVVNLPISFDIIAICSLNLLCTGYSFNKFPYPCAFLMISLNLSLLLNFRDFLFSLLFFFSTLIHIYTCIVGLFAFSYIPIITKLCGTYNYLQFLSENKLVSHTFE